MPCLRRTPGEVIFRRGPVHQGGYEIQLVRVVALLGPHPPGHSGDDLEDHQ